MRIEYVVARAWRRALGWLVPFGMVFAASAGSASAQITVGGPTEVREGGRVSIPITARVTIPTNASTTTVTVTVEGSAGAAGSAGLTAAEPGDFSLSPTSVDLRAPSTVGATATGSVEFQTNADNDAENEAVLLTLTPDNNRFGGTTPITRNITIDDKETQSFEWEILTSNPTEGQVATVTLTAEPSPVDLAWETNLSVSRAGYTLSSTSATLNRSSDSHRFTITAEAQDRNRTADTVELRALLSGTGSSLPGLEPLSIEFADIHSLPDPDKITWRAYLDSNGSPSNRVATVAVEGGAPVHVTVTVDRGTNGYPLGETLIVTPTVRDRAQLSDFTMEPTSIEIASGEGRKSATFQVTALEDTDVGSEDLVLDLVVTGKETATNGSGEVSAENPFSIAIGDETTPLVTTKTERQVERTVTVARNTAAGDDGEFTTGEEFSLGTRDLFTSTSPLQLSAQSSDPSVARVSAAGDTITVIAVGPGTAIITVTGRVVDSATTQTTADAATVEFDVTVDGLDLEITLSAPDRDLTEGDSITVTATANGAVADDTTITLTPVGGNASPADYSVESIMIMSGQTTGTTMLTAREDGMVEQMETLELEGRFGSGMKTDNTLTFNIWDAAVPALPLIAQILLAVFLAVGGYRRYLRRR